MQCHAAACDFEGVHIVASVNDLTLFRHTLSSCPSSIHLTLGLKTSHKCPFNRSGQSERSQKFVVAMRRLTLTACQSSQRWRLGGAIHRWASCWACSASRLRLSTSALAASPAAFPTATSRYLPQLETDLASPLLTCLKECFLACPAHAQCRMPLQAHCLKVLCSILTNAAYAARGSSEGIIHCMTRLTSALIICLGKR